MDLILVMSICEDLGILLSAEMVAVKEIYDAAVEGTNRSLVIFNGELDRIRSGYYPSFFYPGLAKMAKEWLPQFCTAYYIHNFKGRSPGEQGTFLYAYSTVAPHRSA